MQKQINIAILSIHSSPLANLGAKDSGGMSTYLLGIAGALGAEGHQVDIYTRGTAAGSQEKVTEIKTNVRLIEINDNLGPLTKYEMAEYASILAEKIAASSRHHKLHYTILFSHYWVSGLVGLQLQSKWQLPHLLMFHTLGRAKNELCPGEDEPSKRLLAEEKLASTADLFVVAARSERERLLSYYGLDPNLVQVIQAGVDSHLFRPLDRSFAKQLLGLKAEKIILAIGRLEPVKGFDLLLAAAAYIDPALDYRVVIIGGDDQARDLEAELWDMTERLNLADRVTFLGRVPYEELPYYYNAASVTVIASCYESFGLIALESLACHTPIIAGPVGVIPELAEMAGSLNYIHLVPERSPALWAEKIEQVISAPQPFDTEAAAQLLDHFSWTAAARLLADLSHRLLKNAL